MKMREILFRGKTAAIVGSPYNNGKSDGEWVFGYVFSDLGAMKIRQYSAEEPDCTDYEVDPETVGQYTGKELDGIKIFTGDIVESCVDYDDSFGYPVTDVFKSVAIWDEENFCFAFKTDDYIQPFNDWDWNYCSVIGNIHDNPEMLNAVAKDIAFDADAGGLAPATENFQLLEG